MTDTLRAPLGECVACHGVVFLAPTGEYEGFTEAEYEKVRAALGGSVPSPSPEQFGIARAALIRLHAAVTDCHAVRLLLRDSPRAGPMDEWELRTAVAVAGEAVDAVRGASSPAPSADPTESR